LLFKSDMQAFVSLYRSCRRSSTSKTPRSKSASCFKRLIPLLEFGRERDGVDLSGVRLTHHTLKDLGKRNISVAGGEGTAGPITGPGSGAVQDERLLAG
jgi:type I restriction enzyme R subunit